MAVRTSTTLNVHDTPPVIFDALALIWPVQSHMATAWLEVKAENGARLVFFAEDSRPDSKPPVA